METHTRYVIVAIAGMLYFASMLLPTVSPFNPQFSEHVYPGWQAFRAGWQSLLNFEPSEPDCWVVGGAWLANPLTWLAAVATLTGFRRVATVSAWAGVVLCLSVLLRFSVTIAGHPGYWCWLASVGLLAVASSQRRKPSRDRVQDLTQG